MAAANAPLHPAGGPGLASVPAMGYGAGPPRLLRAVSKVPHSMVISPPPPGAAEPSPPPRQTPGWRGAAERAVHDNGPGVLLAFTIAAAATFLTEHYGAPVMLFALLLGIAFHFLAEEGRCVAGVNFTASHLLKIGVALLGARVTLDQIMSLGVFPLLLIPALVGLTLLSGVMFARLAGKPRAFGVLTGGAVAICGASAALAISSVLPRREGSEGDTLFTVVAVTTLSTLAMILYPIIYRLLGFADAEIGLLLGATIHDVAQVVGAGYAVSDEAGDVATYVKLLRVAMLPVVVIAIALIVSRREAGAGGGAPFPWFAAAFAVILAANSLGAIPEVARATMETVSRWLLVAAIAALGVKTSLKAVTELGARHILVVVAESAFLFTLATTALLLVR
ncbi:MAG: putative sulfate exporter family transporter [Caulobacterales bacterium]|nr:putative sulfate exporter family transporter [Caulobacterales bacterium]